MDSMQAIITPNRGNGQSALKWLGRVQKGIRRRVMKNQCAYCYRKFGLVRYRRGFKSFCSKVCVDRYIVLLRAEFLKRLYSAGFSGPAIRYRPPR